MTLWIQLSGERSAKIPRITARGERTVGESVISAFESQDAGALGVEERRLERGFDGVRTGEAQKHPRVGHRREGFETLEKFEFGDARMHIAEGVDKFFALRPDGADDRRIAVPEQRGAKARGEVDEDIPVCIDHVGADGCLPNDRIVGGAALTRSSRAARGERRTFRRFENIEIGTCPLTRDRGPNRRQGGSRLAHGLIFSANPPLSNGGGIERG